MYGCSLWGIVEGLKEGNGGEERGGCGGKGRKVFECVVRKSKQTSLRAHVHITAVLGPARFDLSLFRLYTSSA
jgi:hypothetical protein